MASDARRSSRRIDVDPELIAEILVPFEPACRYLGRASLSFGSEAGIAARGSFAIPQSCYINDTGHLNSIEFTICANQLILVALAQAIVSELAPGIADMSLDELRARQRPEHVVQKLRSSFKRVINARQFEGEVTIGEPVERGRPFEVACRFWDEDEGFAEGRMSMKLAV